MRLTAKLQRFTYQDLIMYLKVFPVLHFISVIYLNVSLTIQCETYILAFLASEWNMKFEITILCTKHDVSPSLWTTS